jgi:hypothetical protein
VQPLLSIRVFRAPVKVQQSDRVRRIGVLMQLGDAQK